MASEKSMSEDEGRVYAMHLAFSITLPMVLKHTIKLGLLDIIAKAGPGAHLSSSEIASFLPVSNHEISSSMIDRILYLLASFSILTTTLDSTKETGGKSMRVYGLTPAGSFFVKGGPECLVSMLNLHCSSTFLRAWECFEEPVLHGEIAFNKAHGMPIAQYAGVDLEFSQLFNEAMAGLTNIITNNLIDVYKGFEGVRVLVDVGGGVGALLNTVITKNPNTRGINFDLPSVVETAPPYEGVQHLGGDMFERVPNGDAILLKNVIHNWDDEQSVKILNRCWEAVEDEGKVIIIEPVKPLTAETSKACKYGAQMDVCMMVLEGGKERTEEEFRAIAHAAGFNKFELVCTFNANSIMELKKW